MHQLLVSVGWPGQVHVSLFRYWCSAQKGLAPCAFQISLCGPSADFLHWGSRALSRAAEGKAEAVGTIL